MDDLVSKLRRLDADRMPTLGDLNRAADRIEALEADNTGLPEARDRFGGEHWNVADLVRHLEGNRALHADAQEHAIGLLEAKVEALEAERDSARDAHEATVGRAEAAMRRREQQRDAALAERDRIHRIADEQHAKYIRAVVERDTLAEMVLAAKLEVVTDDGADEPWLNAGSLPNLTPDQAGRFSAALARLREATPT